MPRRRTNRTPTLRLEMSYPLGMVLASSGSREGVSPMEYEAGDVIVYRPFGGGLRRVRVSERLPDVKHGLPGFDGTVVSGAETWLNVWGYDYQIMVGRGDRH